MAKEWGGSAMTVAEAKQLLQNPFDKKPRLLEVWSEKMNQIAALIEQQAAEIAKKDQLVKKAIDKLFILPGRDECPDDVLCSVTLPNTPDIGDCRKCWLARLEKEAQGVE
jgi:hypothetical protein